jgi:DNA invertase Pin-like site-specific DNA recombinase
MKTKRVVVAYTRVSTTDQHPEIQEKEVSQYLARRDWTLHKVYCDKGFRELRSAGPR